MTRARLAQLAPGVAVLMNYRRADFLRVDRRGFLLALVTMLGVVWFGPIQGVLVAVVIALLHFIQVAARPDIELLGVQPGVHGFHDLRLYPEARTPPRPRP